MALAFAQRLLQVHNIGTAVYLPAAFRMASQLGPFFPIADGRYLTGFGPTLDQKLLYTVSAALSQSKIVFGAAAFIAVAFKTDLLFRMILQVRRMCLHQRDVRCLYDRNVEWVIDTAFCEDAVRVVQGID